jgi:hypothetical protein
MAVAKYTNPQISFGGTAPTRAARALKVAISG